MVAEKLLRILQQKQQGSSDLSEYLTFRFYNAYLLIQCFKIEGDFRRILKYLEASPKNAINDNLVYVCRRPRVKREIAYYVLHILNMKAGAIFKFDSVEKALPLYQQICNLYERWRTNRYLDSQAVVLECHQRNIFGTEEYIQARAMYSECLQLTGKLYDAISQFE